MVEIVKSGQRFVRRVVTEAEALVELADEPYKCRLVGSEGGADVMEVGGSRADHLRQRRPALRGDGLGRPVPRPARARHPDDRAQRVQGHALVGRLLAGQPGQRAAAAHLRHRVAGQGRAARLPDLPRGGRQARPPPARAVELDLFSFPDEIGSGLAVFHPKGGIMRRTMEDYSRRQHEAAGYEFVYTPHITKGQLFETSGHLDWYADGMYPPMHIDEERDAEGNIRRAGTDYYLKPMNCPFHNLIFRSRGRSYRELPLRLFEFGSVYRYEKSGVVHGLTRVRGMTQDDAHIYCTKEQMRRRAAVPARLRARPAQGLRPRRLLPRAVHPQPRQVRRRGRRVGGGHRDPAPRRPRPPASTSSPTRAAPRSTARRSPCRPATRSGAPGRCRPSSWTSRPAGALRARVPGRRRHPPAAGHDPPRPVRLGRALHGRAHRALRRRVPALARPGPGRRHPDHRAPRRLPARGRGARCARRASGSRWTPPTTGCRRRSATPRSRRCPTC